MRLSAIFASFIPVVVVNAATMQVVVGKDNQLTFDPPKLDGVKAGDTIEFQFQSKNHSATQSTFASPCTPMDKGVDSGFFKVNPGSTSFPQWSITLDQVTGPLWFYCKQAGHCSSGMVFAVNPTADKSFDAFQSKAKSGSSGSTTGSSSTSGSSTSGSSTSSSSSSKTSSTDAAGGIATPTSTDSGTGTSAAASATPSKAGGARQRGDISWVLTFVGLVIGLTV